MKWLAIEEPSEVQYLFTEENGNAISTEMMLVIVDNHLETFHVHFSLLWLHLCCGLHMLCITMSTVSTMSTQWVSSVASKQLIPSLTSLAAACGFLWTSDSLLYFFRMDLMPVAWLKSRPKVMADLPPIYLWESDVLEKNSREKSNLFLGRFLYPM